MAQQTNHDLLQMYEDAAECLKGAATESQKSNNVHITKMLINCQNCARLIANIIKEETNRKRLEALRELHLMVAHHQEILSAKIMQLDSGQPLSIGPPTGSQNDTGKDGGDKQTVARKSAIEDTIVTKGKITFSDVAGLNDAKQALKEAIIMPLEFPQLFTGGRKPWKRILLYGPPGTGKSRLAQAVSSEINSTFYCVSSSDLVSSWVGESEKLIKELFSHAKSQAGRSVIFIDEIDSVCRKRSSSEEEYTRRIKTELLKQMEGVDNQNADDHIFLLCATNCPWELDSAFLRRFQKRIYIPLPDRAARISLMKIHTKDNDVPLSPDEWLTLGDATEGYSGSDLATLTLDAMFQPIRDLNNAEYWHKLQGGNYVPCSEHIPGGVKARMQDLPHDKVEPRDIDVADFLQSLKQHRHTVTTEELKQFESFTNNFGQHGK
ncbi:unnamed protein product [Owenia fusiformis]|uniref:Uncharacterized protein n=1 Tax=Owenia fusiformis TaxID=6347 RepID=A0A8J1TS92_OWEFU|nr:unnamed protein product [Owenia fusiformis]